MADAPDLGSGPERVGGSSPLARTTFIEDFEDNDSYRTVTAQIVAATDRPKVRFPKVIRFRRVEATIYGKTKKYSVLPARLLRRGQARHTQLQILRRSQNRSRKKSPRDCGRITGRRAHWRAVTRRARRAPKARKFPPVHRPPVFPASCRVEFRRVTGKIERAQLGRGRRGIFANRRRRQPQGYCRSRRGVS